MKLRILMLVIITSATSLALGCPYTFQNDSNKSLKIEFAKKISIVAPGKSLMIDAPKAKNEPNNHANHQFKQIKTKTNGHVPVIVYKETTANTFVPDYNIQEVTCSTGGVEIVKYSDLAAMADGKKETRYEVTRLNSGIAGGITRPKPSILIAQQAMPQPINE